jgi:hypothetical protein
MVAKKSSVLKPKKKVILGSSTELKHREPEVVDTGRKSTDAMDAIKYFFLTRTK